MEILNRVVSAKSFENRKNSVSYIAWEAFKRTAENTLTTTYTTKIRSRCLDRFLLQQKHPHCNENIFLIFSHAVRLGSAVIGKDHFISLKTHELKKKH